MKAMIESVTCDLEDGNLAIGMISWKDDGGTHQNDLCRQHLAMLSKNAHKPVRGRRPGSTTKKATTRKPIRSKKAAARKTTPKS